MECFGGDVNRMECRVGVDGVELDWDGSGSDVKLGLGDCVWYVLLPKPVANATFSSKSTPPVSHD